MGIRTPNSRTPPSYYTLNGVGRVIRELDTGHVCSYQLSYFQTISTNACSWLVRDHSANQCQNGNASNKQPPR
jgi:hypothetical protein